MLWRCRSSRTPWPFSPTASSYRTPAGTPPPITSTTASSTCIPHRCCAMLQGVSGKGSTHTHTHICPQAKDLLLFSCVSWCCWFAGMSPPHCVRESECCLFWMFTAVWLQMHIFTNYEHSAQLFLSFPLSHLHLSPLTCAGNHSNSSKCIFFVCQDFRRSMDDLDGFVDHCGFVVHSNLIYQPVQWTYNSTSMSVSYITTSAHVTSATPDEPGKLHSVHSVIVIN